MSQAKPTSIFSALTGALVSTVSVVTTTADAANSLANAANQLAKVAENKATRFNELIEIKDQAAYITAKHELDQLLAAVNADPVKGKTK